MNTLRSVRTLSLFAALAAAPALAEESAFIAWTAVGDGIPQPLAGLRGDAQRGRALAIRPDKGNCLTCHDLPIPEEGFHGTIGPSLLGVGARLSEAQLRLRVADEQRLNPRSIMPGFHRDPAGLNQVAWDYAGRTILSAQDVEDVVAYLETLR
ncbi:MAG TPA: sulfur oxidation c-type cytochrome SoxX [Gammaproteobacteria bacterium]